MGHPSIRQMKRTPLRRVSSKRARENRIYLKLAAEHLLKHPFCQCCSLLWPESKVEPHRATQCHHSKGRGKYFLDKSTYRSACGASHHYIHFENPNHAREVGLLPPR
jgi:hypothetical protein